MKVPKNATKVYRDSGTKEVYGYSVSSMPKRVLKCHDCGTILKTDKERALRNDPYLEEIENKFVKGRWCKNCEHEMLMDI